MLKFNQVKPGMVFLINDLSEIIVVLSVRLLNSTDRWLYLICLGENNDIFDLYGLPENEFPHNLVAT